MQDLTQLFSVIGRVVIDVDTGEIISSAGNPQGDWLENACTALT